MLYPDINSQKRTQQNTTRYRTALYLRLSREDGDKTESDSIANQRTLLEAYAIDHPELCIVDEFVDDGYSGSNFERPAFQRLFQELEQGTINCILVKDLSRFGRNYIEVGRYLERIFPVMRVRLIAVTDNYDSQSAWKTSDSIMVPMRNLLNDVDDLKKQAEMIRAEQIKLYESYADGILTRNEYLEKKKGLGEKLADLQEKIRIEEEEQETADELDEEIRSLTKQASQKTYIGGLTKECVDAFVSMVYLYDDQTMKVEFNCEDVIRRALEKYGA